MQADGELTWPIRRSVLDYIASVRGRALLTGGAGVRMNEGITFPVRSATRAGDTVRVSCGGSVRFVAHGGLLDVKIADPHVEISGDTGAVTVEVGGGRQPLAVCGFAGAGPSGDAWLAAEVRLTEPGAAMFGGVYRADDLLDPFHVRVRSFAPTLNACP